MWFLLSFGSAFFDSIKDVFGKQSSLDHDEYVAAWSQRFYASFLLTPLMFLYWPKTVNAEFWRAFVIVAALATVASIWYMKALKYSPLSMVVPIASFAPIFSIVTASVVNHELPGRLGIIGVCLAAAGAYILQFSKRHAHWLAPLTSIFTDRGSRLMFGVALLWGVTSAYDKVAVQQANAFFYVGAINIVYMFTLMPFLLHRPERLKKIFTHARQLAPIGFGQALAVLCQMLALPLTFVAYVGAVKRASSIFGVAWGKWFFKEENIGERLIGAGVILAGVVLMIVG